MDEWGAGRYEETAAELVPAADAAVAALRLDPGEHVLDVACGTGNATVLAAAAGARVAGLDASPRLVGVARERVPEGEFVVGDAAALPYADGEFDAAVSVFGVIFARPAERAAAEIARVVRRGGRIAITAWLPSGRAFEAVMEMRRALAKVRPPDGPPPPDWSDRDTLDRLLGRFGALEVTEHHLEFPDLTPEEVWARWERAHPAWIGARSVLEPAGAWDALREATTAALRGDASDDGRASPYVLIVLRRG